MQFNFLRQDVQSGSGLPEGAQLSQRMDWRIFEDSLKTEARFFSRMARAATARRLSTREDADPGTKFQVTSGPFNLTTNCECRCIPTTQR
jgi:hypothetical protein